MASFFLQVLDRLVELYLMYESPTNLHIPSRVSLHGGLLPVRGVFATNGEASN